MILIAPSQGALWRETLGKVTVIPLSHIFFYLGRLQWSHLSIDVQKESHGKITIIPISHRDSGRQADEHDQACIKSEAFFQGPVIFMHWFIKRILIPFQSVLLRVQGFLAVVAGGSMISDRDSYHLLRYRNVYIWVASLRLLGWLGRTVFKDFCRKLKQPVKRGRAPLKQKKVYFNRTFSRGLVRGNPWAGTYI